MRLRHLALPSAAGLVLLAVPFAPSAVAAAACDPAASSCTAVFEYTGAAQTFTVPRGVSNVIVALGGGAGGNGLAGDGTADGPNGAPGGAVEAIVPVTPGEVLTFVVGGKGGDAVAVAPGDTLPPVAQGGYGGGGDGTSVKDGPVGAGGGGSFLFGNDGLLLAVGGGGGAGFTGDSDSAANGGGGNDGAGTAGSPAALGGSGATPTAAGAGGVSGELSGSGSGPATSPTAFGNGGASAAGCSAGGGGGGYFGGGSGACVITQPAALAKGAAKPGAAKASTTAAAAADAPDAVITSAGGGGGGAGFVAAGVSTIPSRGDGAGPGDGVAALGYTTAATTTALTSGTTTLAPGQETTINAAVDGPALTIGAEAGPADSTAATAVARAAFGANASALAAAVPSQPAPAGATITPGTACGFPVVVPVSSGAKPATCTVTFFVNGTQLGDPISVDPATGIASVVFTAGSDEGVRQITARYDGNLYYLQSTSDPLAITVAGLANTGPSNVAPMLGTSAALLLVGAGLVVFGRRRPQIGSHRAV